MGWGGVSVRFNEWEPLYVRLLFVICLSAMSDVGTGVMG
jgi:phage shock protein PspC (stress-responsive transcriptional regulator)